MRRILHKVKGWIASTTATRHERTALVYYYAPGKGEAQDQAQADQLAVLRRLSSFSDKEHFPVTIVFAGRPTRKVPDGSRQGAVTVRYAMPDQVLKVVENATRELRKQHAVVIVSDRADLEKYADKEGLRRLRAATLEKTMDAVSGPLRREPREPREPRKPQGETPAPQQPEARPPAPKAAEPKPAEDAPKAPRPEVTAAKKPADAAILDLIDPL